MTNENIEERYTRGDREMLIEVKAGLKYLIQTVDELKSNLAARVAKLETDKASEAEIRTIYETRGKRWENTDRRLDTLEKEKIDNTCYDRLKSRVEKLENWRWWVIGIFSAIGVIISLVVYIYLKDINDLKSALEKHLNQTEKSILIK